MYISIDPDNNPYDKDVEDLWDGTGDLIAQFLTLYIVFDKSLNIPMKQQSRSEYQLKVLSFLKCYTKKDYELAKIYNAEDYPYRDEVYRGQTLRNIGKCHVG